MIDGELSVPYVTSRQNIPTLLSKEISDTRITFKNVLVEKRTIKLFQLLLLTHTVCICMLNGVQPQIYTFSNLLYIKLYTVE